MARIAGHYEWADDDLTPGRKREGGLHQNLFDARGNLKGSARFVPLMDVALTLLWSLRRSTSLCTSDGGLGRSKRSLRLSLTWCPKWSAAGSLRRSLVRRSGGRQRRVRPSTPGARSCAGDARVVLYRRSPRREAET